MYLILYKDSNNTFQRGIILFMNNSLGDQRMQIFSIVLQSHPQWKKAEKMLNLLMRLEEDVDRVEDEVDFKSVMID